MSEPNPRRSVLNRSPTACRDYITIDATVSVTPSLGNLKNKDRLPIGVHGLKPGGRGFESHRRNVLRSAVAQRIEHRKSLINTSSVLLIHARLPVWSTWQETDEQVLRVRTPPGPLRLDAMDRSSAQPSSSVLRVLIRLPGAEYIHHQQSPGSGSFPVPKRYGASAHPSSDLFFQWRSLWPTRRCSRA